MNNGLSGLFLCFTPPLMVSQEPENDGEKGEGQKTGMDIPFISPWFIVIRSWHDRLHLTSILTRQHNFERDPTLKKCPPSFLATRSPHLYKGPPIVPRPVSPWPASRRRAARPGPSRSSWTWAGRGSSPPGRPSLCFPPPGPEYWDTSTVHDNSWWS